MRYVALTLAAVVVYLAAGIMTYGPTASRLAAVCSPVPNAQIHAVLWPISWGLTAGLPNRC